VQRVWLHPGQQQHLTDFVGCNILDPGFRRGDEAFFNKLLNESERLRHAIVEAMTMKPRGHEFDPGAPPAPTRFMNHTRG
jgi:hypothetical protein